LTQARLLRCAALSVCPQSVTSSETAVRLPPAVATPFELVAHYDRLRLSIYKARGPRGTRIAIEERGESTFLRFDDVGYFNIVYSRNDDVQEQFEEIDRFFLDSPFGCRLLSPRLQADGRIAEECRRRGWVPQDRYAWLSGPCPPSPPKNSRVTVRSVSRHEADAFFRTYLAAFEASPERVPPALDNMRHLFDDPSLYFQFALDGGVPAGVGILLQVGETALLGAGAMMPGHRGFGGHEALIAARLHLAHSIGCTSTHSWAVAGSRSHRALERMGLETVATTCTWRRAATT
jgi:hypothetical protein